MSTSSIEWTGRTENVVDGCELVAPECENCYALTWSRRQMGPWRGRTFDQVYTHPGRLRNLMVGKPSRIFLCSMGDLFHRAVPDSFLDGVWAAMALGRQHTFQVLTKRPERAKRYLRDLTHERVEAAAQRFGLHAQIPQRDRIATILRRAKLSAGPLAHVQLGTSVGCPESAWRIAHLQATNVALRFLSIEPLIADLDLHGKLDGIGWCIVGGESGAGARPMQLAWMRSVVAACKDAGVPVFVKQMGLHWARENRARGAHPAGGDFELFPPDLQIREFPRGARSRRVRWDVLACALLAATIWLTGGVVVRRARRSR